jgi:biopolymer transport protein ExbB/TolQ
MDVSDIFESGGLLSYLLGLMVFAGLVSYFFALERQSLTRARVQAGRMTMKIVDDFQKKADEDSFPVNAVQRISKISPGLGLMGTAWGMSKAMAELRSGIPDPSVLAPSVSLALGTTLFGLFVWLLFDIAHLHLVHGARRTVRIIQAAEEGLERGAAR